MVSIKSSTPQKLSFLASIIIIVFTSVLMIVLHWLGWIIWMVIFIPVSFLICYFTILYILSVLINDKLTPIYKTIREVPIEGKRLTKLIAGKTDIIEEVDQEVKQWAEDKLAEIGRLRDLEKYRKDFVGNVSHELKTPIFNIQGYILTLLDGGLEDPKINRLYLERTEKSIDRMISIVEDLESITKLESGEMKLNMEPFDLLKLTEEVFELELRDANGRRISMNLILKANKPVIVMADRKRIFEVISNLVGNAIKYGKKGGNVNVGFYDMDKMLLIEVSDDGIGIEKKDLIRIFERFYRVDKSRSRMQGGTGLGLSIVKHIIEAHEQTIHVKSQADKGTTFTFMLEKYNK
ncbi:MAG TPA: ATP-binding protein [Prolixibacteraceae bacterium]|nr:ATP-binding protein [Prolixibacteraceae bacterium]